MAILRVPVVGRDDRHDVDVFAVEELAIVLECLDIAFLFFFDNPLSLFGVIDDRRRIRQPHRRMPSHSGPTDSQRSPVPMQPTIGRSFFDSDFASSAIPLAPVKKYGAVIAAPAKPAVDFRNVRRDFLFVMIGSLANLVLSGELVQLARSRRRLAVKQK